MTDEKNSASDDIVLIERRIVDWMDQNLSISDKTLKEKVDNKKQCSFTDRDLHGFVLGELDEQESYLVCRHIELCTQCASKALEFSILEEELDAELFEIQPRLSSEVNLSDQLDKTAESSQTIFNKIVKKANDVVDQIKSHIEVFFAIAVSCLLLYALWPTSYENEINQFYKHYASYHSEPESGLSDDAFKLPWEKPSYSYGFSPIVYDISPSNLAFGAGLWEGRSSLRKDQYPDVMPEDLMPPDNLTSWNDSSYRLYYQLGKWAFLTRTACLSDNLLSENFWRDQRLILNRLEDEMVRMEDIKYKDVSTYIQRKLKQIKKVIDTTPNGIRGHKVSEELYGLINYMCPK